MKIHPSVTELVRLYLGNSWSKTGAFLAVAGASALFGWVDQVVAHLLGFNIQQPPTWACFIVMFTGVGLLVWGYSKSSSSPALKANAHDVELMARFQQLVAENVLEFLRNHNFGTPWRRSLLDPIGEIAEVWHGARFEFQDADLNEALSKVKASANHLEILIAEGSWPARNNAQMQTAKTDEDYQLGTQPATVNKIRQMNQSASTLVNDIDTLERLARGKL